MMMVAPGLITSSKRALFVARSLRVAFPVVPAAFSVQAVGRANDAAEMSV